MNVSVIVAAAGTGSRFGGKQNKIFEKIGAQAVFLKSLELFANRDDVGQMILVVNGDDLDEIRQRFGGNLGFMGVKLVTGGATRSQSVRNALAAVDEGCDFVAIHDAVRPCVSQVWIDAVFAEAAKTGAAILAYPIHGTMKKVSAAPMTDEPPDDIARVFGPEAVRARKKPPQPWIIDETVSRAGLWQAQTPQVFRRAVIERAYASAGGDEATDDAQLVEAIGQPVYVVMGDPRNIKITTPGDLALAAAVIGTLPKPPPKKPRGPFEEAQW